MSTALSVKDRVVEKHALVRGMEKSLMDMMDNDKQTKRMLQVVCNAITKNPKLADCTGQSLRQCAMTAAEFRLWPNTPEQLCYIIPYKVKGVETANFQLGYHGIIELAYRSGHVQNIFAEKVCENDEFDVSYAPRYLKHKPAKGNRGPVIGYYGMVELTGGKIQFAYMSLDEVRAHGIKFSRNFNSNDSVWKSNFDAMALKTVVIAACKFVPRSVDDKLFKAIQLDQAIDMGIPPAKMGVDSTVLDVTACEVVDEGATDEDDEEAKRVDHLRSVVVDALDTMTVGMEQGSPEYIKAEKEIHKMMDKVGCLDHDVWAMSGGQLEAMQRLLEGGK